MAKLLTHLKLEISFWKRILTDSVPGCSEVASDPTLVPTSSPLSTYNSTYTRSLLKICVQLITILKSSNTAKNTIFWASPQKKPL